ncbi:hypothetical protein N6H18_03180 [Reichenbachiella agarivorans]|uniref:Uncharacterized protein n=1 Tax=Reichenbachiella agarivorans TaxID=2979464 RepID=A0ABY6CR32_9BACT|nr:hypothetical protein [Reichenbachiella agarivorans]UXP32957.1 hypothetical protein N6H18_03180 [Reichenbachiella agarivorans]
MNLKKIASIFCLILVTGLAHADPTTDKGEKTKSEKEKYNSNPEKSHDEATLKANNSAAQKEASPQSETKASTNDPDSSYYSVNKFNYLLYFVYKMKYLNDEDPELKLGMAP